MFTQRYTYSHHHHLSVHDTLRPTSRSAKVVFQKNHNPNGHSGLDDGPKVRDVGDTSAEALRQQRDGHTVQV